MYDYKNWKKVAGHLPGRSEVQCLHRWSKVLNPDIIKTPWVKEVSETDPLLWLLIDFLTGG